MGDSYEQSADHRPWQARRPDWAGPGQREDRPDPPANPRAGAQGPPPGWAGRGLSQDSTWPPKLSSTAGLGPADEPAQNAYPNHPSGDEARGGSVERRPAYWPAVTPTSAIPPFPTSLPTRFRASPPTRFRATRLIPFLASPLTRSLASPLTRFRASRLIPFLAS